MLLTRRINEAICIEISPETVTQTEIIEIRLIGIKGNQAKLGVKASPNIPVHREEVMERVKKEREQER